MCGIFAVFNYPDDIHAFRKKALQLSKRYIIDQQICLIYILIYIYNIFFFFFFFLHHFRLRHRGPDWNGCKISGNNILCHERLAVVGVGKQFNES